MRSLRFILIMAGLIASPALAAPGGPSVKLTPEQRKAVEAGIAGKLFYPASVTFSSVSAQRLPGGIVVCGRYHAPRDYHPDVSRRVFIGKLEEGKLGYTFKPFGPPEYFLSAIAESMCKKYGML